MAFFCNTIPQSYVFSLIPIGLPPIRRLMFKCPIRNWPGENRTRRYDCIRRPGTMSGLSRLRLPYQILIFPPSSR